ncbi:hypothetical protein GW931_02980 [archaeon]|nr:hypothetical protein [archaeon]
MKKKNNKKVMKKVHKKVPELKPSNEARNILFGFLGFALTVFLVQFSYKGQEETLSFNPLQVIDFFSAQIKYLINLPQTILTVLGVILILIPPVAFYFLSKEIFGRKK